MFRFFLIIVVLLLAWPTYKHYLPSFFRTTSISNTISSIIYDWEDVIYDEFRELDKPKYWGKIIDVEYPLLLKTIDKVQTAHEKMVIFLYKTDCSMCRYLLYDINELAKKTDDVKFMVVAFDDNKKNVSRIINNFDKLHFKPLISPESNYTALKARFIKDNIIFQGLPNVVYYNFNSGYSKGFVPGLFTKNNISRIINK